MFYATFEGPGFTPPSDRITLAAIGMGHQGFDITMELLARPDVQVVAVCDCNQGSKDYVEYDDNGILKSARRLLGPGYENWGADLASPGEVQLSHTFRTSVGIGGREPAKRLVEAYYGSRNGSATGSYQGCTAYRDWRELLDKRRIWTPFTSPRPTTGTPASRSRQCANTRTSCVRNP